MNRVIRNLLIVAVVILAVLSAVIIRAGRSVFIAIENGTEEVFYSAGVKYGYKPGSPDGRGSSTWISNETQPGKRFHFGWGPSSQKKLGIKDGAFPIWIDVEPDNPETSPDNRSVQAGEVLVPVQRGKCCVIVVTGSKEEGYKASYSHVERAAVWMLIFTH